MAASMGVIVFGRQSPASKGVNMEVEEAPALEGATKQWLMETVTDREH
jgi:hypothetical protein